MCVCVFLRHKDWPKKTHKHFGTHPVPGQSRKFVYVYVFFFPWSVGGQPVRKADVSKPICLWLDLDSSATSTNPIAFGSQSLSTAVSLGFSTEVKRQGKDDGFTT